MEGRDIGTAVFPDAEVKIFLDAAPEVRSSRRYRQVASSEREPAPVTETAVTAEMQARDERDRNRAQSPLKAADDAIVLDSTALSLDEVLAKSEEIVRRFLEGAASGCSPHLERPGGLRWAADEVFLHMIQVK